ncbi:Arc family DNA-binding protein [Rhodobacteraceae bacterium 2376]|uniref:Arc family DNA-binding protein n=1 Tax=Rhabdonatronobacter sediminivivens TaxID=2743469 RepID=A0A7Z0KXP7_9RHOB|nr:Arc family DNA-binding protein [Rhabdonatronobacter sediminivivens]NYS24604.1 Arc family DNA-binding protein [Rhabdonatronobacter sediminivivens]
MVDSVGRDSDKFMLRFPDGMREAIRVAAESNHRSMNAEIVARLSESLNTGFGPDLLRLHLFVGAPQEKLNAADVLESYAAFLRDKARSELSDKGS